VINQNTTPGHSLQSAAVAEAHFAHIVIAAYATEYDIRCAGGPSRAIGTLTGKLLKPLIGSRRGTIINRDMKTRATKMPCHRKAHDAQTDKRNV
jgi:hypothetical protein